MTKDLSGVYDSRSASLNAGATIDIFPEFAYEQSTGRIAQAVSIENNGTTALTVTFNGSLKTRTINAGARFVMDMPINRITLTNGSGTAIAYAIFMLDGTLGDIHHV